MDKYEFNLKIEQLKKLIDKGDYFTALKIVQSIDWNRVRNTNLLTTAAAVYEKNDMLQEAKDMLVLAFERAPVGKHLLYKLSELSCETGDLDEAEDYYREFRAVDATDIGNYTLQYLILKARHAPYERQLMPLERYCEIDPDEKWLYELATVYEYSNRIDDCIRVCDRLALLYGGSSYGLKALRLKMRYAELSDAQMNILYPRSTASADGIGGMGAYTENKASGETQDYGHNTAPQVNDAKTYGNAGTAAYGNQGTAYDAAAGMVQEALANNAETPSAGIYDDRDYNTQQEIKSPAYVEEVEPLAGNTENDIRKSDALAAERYADEDALFDAYVRNYADKEENRPIAATVEVVNGTASVKENAEPEPLDDEGVQMKFDFGGSIPVVVDEPRETAVQPEAGSESEAASAAVLNSDNKAAGEEQAKDETVSAADDAVGKAQPIAKDIVNPFAQPEQSAANSASAEHRAPIAPNIPSAIPHQAVNAARVTEAAANAAVNVAMANMNAAAATAAVSNTVANASETAAEQAAANPRVQQSAPEVQLKRQPQSIPQQAKTMQQPTQRPLVPHQQLKSATPVKGLHMIVEAKTAAEGLGIAVDELKNIHEEKNIDHASIKTSADKLNKNGITEAILAKVSGKDFVIENAGALSKANIDIVYNFICTDKTGTIVVLIDTPEGLDRVEELRPELFDLCDYVSDIEEDDEASAASQPQAKPAKQTQSVQPEYSAEAGAEDAPYDEPYEDDDEAYDENDEEETETDSDDEIAEDRTPVKRSNGKVNSERFYNVKTVTPESDDYEMESEKFAQYCVQYAASIDCSITGKSLLALYERIELMEENDIPLSKTNAEQLIEDAADRAEKPPIGKRLAGMFKSKYDKNGLLILKEDDFIY
ncbi:MAG: hypothetical protein Q4P22_00835 [Eubacteriales bacterium]|nr:hypothetical protein [Eubacteriales bacterium]